MERSKKELRRHTIQTQGDKTGRNTKRGYRDKDAKRHSSKTEDIGA